MTSTEIGTAYTSQEAAALLRRSTGTLANWRVSGKGPPFIRIGGPITYPKAEFDKWRQEHMQPGAPVHRARKSQAREVSAN